MAITITPVTTFKHLNSDPTYSIKPGGVGREREMIVDVAITAGTTYTTGGLTLDFATPEGVSFNRVYLVNNIQGHGGLSSDYVPASGDDAATGKIKLYGKNSGVAATSASTGTVTCATVLENTFADADITCATVLENTFATGTATCATVLAGDTVTVNGLLYTGVSGARANNTEFSVDTGNNETALDLAAAITADTRTGFAGDLTASAVATNVCTITTDVAGVGGNAITLSSSDGATLAVSGALLTGGVDADTVTINGLVYTAVAGTKADNTEFSTDTGDTATGIDLADSINNDARSGTTGDISATETTGVVTVTTDVAGTAGNAITIVSSDGVTLAVTGSGFFTGGVDADTFTVNGLVYTAVAGAKADNTEFSTDTGDNATATDLADSITNDARTGITVASLDQTATSNAAIVTILCSTLGEAGNGIDLASSDGGTLAVSGANLAGGVGGDISGFDELEAGDTTIQNKTLRCLIRGI